MKYVLSGTGFRGFTLALEHLNKSEREIQFFKTIRISLTWATMSGKIIDPVIRSIHYIVALTIFVISLYLVKYEGLQLNVKNTCCESDAPWILKLERVSLNESKIVKKCSRDYNKVVKVGFVVLPFFHFSSHFPLLFFDLLDYLVDMSAPPPKFWT